MTCRLIDVEVEKSKFWLSGSFSFGTWLVLKRKSEKEAVSLKCDCWLLKGGFDVVFEEKGNEKESVASVLFQDWEDTQSYE